MADAKRTAANAATTGDDPPTKRTKTDRFKSGEYEVCKVVGYLIHARQFKRVRNVISYALAVCQRAGTITGEDLNLAIKMWTDFSTQFAACFLERAQNKIDSDVGNQRMRQVNEAWKPYIGGRHALEAQHLLQCHNL